jgi:hypothetical protein
MFVVKSVGRGSADAGLFVAKRIAEDRQGTGRVSQRDFCGLRKAWLAQIQKKKKTKQAIKGAARREDSNDGQSGRSKQKSNSDLG